MIKITDGMNVPHRWHTSQPACERCRTILYLQTQENTSTCFRHRRHSRQNLTAEHQAARSHITQKTRAGKVLRIKLCFMFYFIFLLSVVKKRKTSKVQNLGYSVFL